MHTRHARGGGVKGEDVGAQTQDKRKEGGRVTKEVTGRGKKKGGTGQVMFWTDPPAGRV